MRKLILLLALMPLLTGANLVATDVTFREGSNYVDYCQDDSTVLCLRMNDSDDGVLIDDSNTQTDPFVATNGAIYTASGYEGGGYTFDGTNDRLDGPADVGVFDYTNTDSFSMGAWFKSGGDSERQSIFNKRNSGSTAQGVLFWMETTGVFWCQLSDGTTTKSTTSTTTGMDDDTWNHVVCTVDNSTETLTMYINGFSEDTDDTTGHGSYSSNRKMRIGDGNVDVTGSSLREWKGELDEIFIIERALTSDEVLDIYRNGLR